MEYRTISEVVNPLYIRATQITRNRWLVQRLGIYSDLHIYISYIHAIFRQDEVEKKEKKQLGRETRICFWSQVHCVADRNE